MHKKEIDDDIDIEKCQNCPIPISYCDGMTRFKCGYERKDVKRYCVYDKLVGRDL